MKTLLKKIFLDPDKIATPTARSIFLSNGNNSPEKEFAFFCSLKLKNGVTKTTDRDRMRDVDAWFIDLLPKDKYQTILDVAISSGITTVELCEMLDSKNIGYHMTGMDSDMTAFLLIFSDDKSILLDKEGQPIHYEIGGKGFGYVKGTNIKHFAQRAFLDYQTRLFINFRLKGGLRSNTNNGHTKIHRIDLVSREIKKNPVIELVEDSIFSPGGGKKYSLIRAANILNKSYFSDERLVDAVQKLRLRLESNGFLLVCRTNMEGQNNATLFRLSNEDQFEISGRFGNGSEIEDLVMGLNA
ncbi:MAG: hypothetical protein ABIO36_04910 [Pyrinomonadaceae bacterium]